MSALSLIATILNLVVLLYLLLLVARMILDWMPMLARDWRPKGFGLVLAELVFTLTDPPLKFFRRFIKPVRIGPVALDLSFTIVFLLCLILYRVTLSLAG